MGHKHLCAFCGVRMIVQSGMSEIFTKLKLELLWCVSLHFSVLSLLQIGAGSSVRAVLCSMKPGMIRQGWLRFCKEVILCFGK